MKNQHELLHRYDLHSGNLQLFLNVYYPLLWRYALDRLPAMHDADHLILDVLLYVLSEVDGRLENDELRIWIIARFKLAVYNHLKRLGVIPQIRSGVADPNQNRFINRQPISLATITRSQEPISNQLH